MSLKSFLKSIVGSKPGKVVANIVLTDAAQAVAALKNTPIGQSVADDIKALSSSTLTGPQKFEQVVESTLPLIQDLLATGGLKKNLKEVEDIGRALVQDVFNSVVSKKADVVGSLILQLLRLK